MKKRKKRVRSLAICVFRKDDRILVAEGYDPVKKQTFYRPLGGGIEFGERSEETVRRELREEINVEVGELFYLGTLEDIFTFNGMPSHEIVMVYDGVLIDSGLYDQAEIVGNEADMGINFTAVWRSLADFESGKSILYPDRLIELLSQGSHGA